MATITTKYSIGDKVYIVSSRGLETIFDVKREEITGINIGGKYWEKYRIGYNDTRGESDIYTDLETVKKAAKKKAKEHYDNNVKQIDDTELDEVEIQ